MESFIRGHLRSLAVEVFLFPLLSKRGQSRRSAGRNFIRREAKRSMRSRMAPCRQRWMFVVP
jgi:hypothetical protein